MRRWSLMPRGGHFASSEQPALVVAELQEFFGLLS
jgi:microsomal epoxide hydrolase